MDTEKTEHGDAIPETDVALRRAMAALSAENVQIYDNLRSVQTRCTELLLKARAWRTRIVELGGDDPGPP